MTSSEDEPDGYGIDGGVGKIYVMTGSAAAGLTGLTFVVISLAASALGVSRPSLRAFVTPTIVHFSVVLAMAAYLSVPHHGVMSLSLGFGVTGLGGLICAGVIAVTLRDQKSKYVPAREDWA